MCILCRPYIAWRKSFCCFVQIVNCFPGFPRFGLKGMPLLFRIFVGLYIQQIGTGCGGAVSINLPVI